jgi:hypothetical protein
MESRFTFNESVIIEMSTDEETMMISIKEQGDGENQARGATLYPEEIDLMISTLNFYKTQLKKN